MDVYFPATDEEARRILSAPSPDLFAAARNLNSIGRRAVRDNSATPTATLSDLDTEHPYTVHD